jgi:hypothetical protein
MPPGASADADLAGDRRGGQPVVAGDHVYADPCPVYPRYRGGYLRARRVLHRGHAEQA